MSARNPASASGRAPGKRVKRTECQHKKRGGLQSSRKAKRNYSMEVPRAFGEALQTVRKNLRTAALFMIDQLPTCPDRRQLEPTLAALAVLEGDISAFRLLVNDLTKPKRVGFAHLSSLTQRSG